MKPLIRLIFMALFPYINKKIFNYEQAQDFVIVEPKSKNI